MLTADVVGYSRLMADDDVDTLRTLTVCQQAIRSVVERHGGRVVDAAGDCIMVEFASVVGSVLAAVEIQEDAAARNADKSRERWMQFRIGIEAGEVIVEGDRLYGDALNVAARIQQIAEPG